MTDTEQPSQWAASLLAEVLSSDTAQDAERALQRAFTERTTELVADNAKLRDALRFYAGMLSFPHNAWVQPSVVDYSRGGDGHHPDGPPIPSDTLLFDGGKHARQALAQQDKPDGK